MLGENGTLTGTPCNNPAFGHIVCQPIRSLQVGPDLPDRPHVSVKQNDVNLKVVKLVSYKLSIWNYIFTLLQLGKNWLL